MYSKILKLTSCLLVLGCGFAFSQTGTITVTGSKIEQDVSEAVESVDIISSEDIAESGAKNVAEALESIPGIQISGMTQSTISMQGFDGAYVKVLVDGIELPGDFAGATAVNQIPVSDIERIEVVKGASSVLYGSDAMGGVINIITKRPESGKVSGSVKLETSSSLRSYADANIGYGNDNFALSLNGSFDYDDGKTTLIENNLGNTINFYAFCDLMNMAMSKDAQSEEPRFGTTVHLHHGQFTVSVTALAK